MFLTDDDYKGVCVEEDLDIIMQSDRVNRQRVEQTSIEEISLMLRSRYDVDAAYAARGEDRNPWLVQITVNVSLYYMVHCLPQNMAIEARRELYDIAFERLRQIQLGKGSIDLPLYPDDGSGGGSGPIRAGSMPRSTYDY